MSDLDVILATDCGSTTTKAILIERRDGHYRLIARGEAPTTVEAPAEDVTRGVINAINEIEDLTGRQFVADDRLIVPRAEKPRSSMSTSSVGVKQSCTSAMEISSRGLRTPAWR